MFCYRDMTYCDYYRTCKDSENCHRPLTKKVKKDAELKNLSICQFVSKPNCYKEI